jgi:chemotaxis protein MotB
MAPMRTLIPLLLLGAVGCVSQSTFDALQSQYDATQASLQERNAALNEANKKIDGLTGKVKTLEEQIAEDKQSITDLNARIAKLMLDMQAASKDKSKLQTNLEQMTAALAELEKRRAQTEARVNEFKALLARFKSLIDAGKLKVRIVEGRMVVVLATDILFGSGSAALSKDGKAAIAEVARLLADIPERKFQVEGHSDNVPIATQQYPSNWELASSRAVNVVKAMIEAGMPKDRVSAASFADSRPAQPNDSPEGKAANRRIEISIVPDLSGLPGFDELKKVEG